MNKKQKIQLGIIYTCIVILILIVVFYLVSYIWDYVKLREDSKRIVAEFNELYESEEKQTILFASPYCHFCQEFKPLLETIAKENNFEFYYFDTSSIMNDEMEEIIKKLELNIDGVPHLAVIENKKTLGEQSGSRDKETTINFLTQNGVIKEEVSE